MYAPKICTSICIMKQTDVHLHCCGTKAAGDDRWRVCDCTPVGIWPGEPQLAGPGPRWKTKCNDYNRTAILDCIERYCCWVFITKAEVKFTMNKQSIDCPSSPFCPLLENTSPFPHQALPDPQLPQAATRDRMVFVSCQDYEKKGLLCTVRYIHSLPTLSVHFCCGLDDKITEFTSAWEIRNRKDWSHYLGEQ